MNNRDIKEIIACSIALCNGACLVLIKKNMLGKKNRWKNVRKHVLYSHEYRDQKMGGKERAKQFFKKHTNSASEKCEEKNRRKKL